MTFYIYNIFYRLQLEFASQVFLIKNNLSPIQNQIASAEETHNRLTQNKERLQADIAIKKKSVQVCL